MCLWQKVAMDSLKLHSEPAMPYPSMPYEPATPETGLWPFQACSLRLSPTTLDTTLCTPMGKFKTFFCRHQRCRQELFVSLFTVKGWLLIGHLVKMCNQKTPITPRGRPEPGGR
jgi:hypothetical protein